jgi:hypothetical protein
MPPHLLGCRAYGSMLTIEAPTFENYSNQKLARALEQEFPGCWCSTSTRTPPCFLSDRDHGYGGNPPDRLLMCFAGDDFHPQVPTVHQSRANRQDISAFHPNVNLGFPGFLDDIHKHDNDAVEIEEPQSQSKSNDQGRSHGESSEERDSQAGLEPVSQHQNCPAIQLSPQLPSSRLFTATRPTVPLPDSGKGYHNRTIRPCRLHDSGLPTCLPHPSHSYPLETGPKAPYEDEHFELRLGADEEEAEKGEINYEYRVIERRALISALIRWGFD